MRKPLFAAALITLATAAAPAPRLETAVFAGGCFWSSETDFARLPGVVSMQVGYTGGHVPHPSYAQVSAGDTGHREAIRVTYDPTRISYARVVDAYWHMIDPTDGSGTFCDRGDEYRDAIFALSPEQKRIAEASRAIVARMPRFAGKPIATQIFGAAPFYPAEAYHQDYHDKNPLQYMAYREGCGRDRALRAIWGATPAGARVAHR
jgi:peptide-methionine (S)-S-oxide reductase